MMVGIYRHAIQAAATGQAGLLLRLLDAVVAGLAEALPILAIPEQAERLANLFVVARSSRISQAMRDLVVHHGRRHEHAALLVKDTQRMLGQEVHMRTLPP